MRFELIGKTRAKLCKVEPYAKKMGQKDLIPGIKIRVMATVPNNVLEMFDPSLRTFLYEKTPSSVKVQKQLEGIEIVSDLPQLRQAGARLGALHWNDEMTGCVFSIDHGIGGPSNIKLRDSKVDSFKLVAKDGGTTQVFFTLYSTDVDRDSSGALNMLHQHEVEIELTAPQVAQQKSIPLDDKKDEEGEESGAAAKVDDNPFPIKGDKPGTTAASPLTPEQAFVATAGASSAPAPKVTTRRPSRLAVAK
ncbi:hypothetical protein RD110_15805 [Rhodoferax koreense]|uniref:Uncharacterized protein n=1 Tax=Rhodoferax koreensis TaxID=1842727 RepID=A0A1P8JXL1_9BURK|nr:hypothetical protein [Rhodoferax koreense]APW38486.1 hypothetical protein RD110_15805 [Rhodoferax koreense]